MINLRSTPSLPKFLSVPLKILPPKTHSRVLVKVLNYILAENLKAGDLDFLDSKSVCIFVTDINIKYFISLEHQRLIALAPEDNNDIEIMANVYDFLQLAARQQDPDTLMFQRRLVLQGNTELGLEIKNLLDSIDIESSAYLTKIEYLLQKSLPVYHKLFR